MRCELAILDERPGNLLDLNSLQSVFALGDEGEPLQQGLKAMQEIRDLVLHGAWQALQGPLHLYHHLIVKVIYCLCDRVEISTSTEKSSAAS